jgi:hypothetical protein
MEVVLVSKFNDSEDTIVVEVLLKEDPETGKIKLVLEKPSPRRVEIENKLKAILALYDEIVSKRGEWCEKDLNNLEQDINEVLSRNSKSTDIRVA